MKNKTGFYTVLGISVGTAIGAAGNNIPAGVGIGSGIGILLGLMFEPKPKRKQIKAQTWKRFTG